MKAYHQTYTSTGDVIHLYQKWLKIEMFPGVSAFATAKINTISN